MTQITSKPGTQASETVHMRIDDPNLDFDSALHQAKTKALAINPNAMQLAWYDRRVDKGFPDYDCGAEDRPPWQVFAESRGSNLTIDINDGAYIFLYLMM